MMLIVMEIVGMTIISVCLQTEGVEVCSAISTFGTMEVTIISIATVTITTTTMITTITITTVTVLSPSLLSPSLLTSSYHCSHTSVSLQLCSYQQAMTVS